MFKKSLKISQKSQKISPISKKIFENYQTKEYKLKKKIFQKIVLFFSSKGPKTPLQFNGIVQH